MSRNKRPRKAYRPRPVVANTLDLALHHAAKPAAADRDEVLGILRQAIRALREGVATEHQWSIVAGSVAVAQAIERGGIVRGLHEHLRATESTLQAIYDRAMQAGRWTRATLYGPELAALDTFMDLHAFQVAQLGRAEFLAAIDTAHRDIVAQGHTPHLARDLERMAA